MKRVYIKTYGCQMNERDSEAVAALLRERGYVVADSEGDADVILLNTCSVRDLAEQKAIGKMGMLAHLKKRNPHLVLGYMGCMAQSRGAELLQNPAVNLVVGTQRFHHVPDYVDRLLADGVVADACDDQLRTVSGGAGWPQPDTGTETAWRDGDAVPHQRPGTIVDIAEEAGSESTIRDHLVGSNGDRQVSAFVSIMQGCDMFCTFCIVPYTRGGERSRSIQEIVAEVRDLVEQGVREVTLLGQIVTSYGRKTIRKKNGRSPFVQLLEAVHEVNGLERIRFTSPHPKGFGDDLVAAYRELPKLCEYAHLPVQSGSNRVLRAMNRGYSREWFLRVAEKLRKARPDIALGTDVIVGFPGETEDEFGQTASLLREVQFDQAYIFKYSKRRDTPAAVLPGAVSDRVKEERNQAVLEIVNDSILRRNRSLIGTTVEILVEGRSEKAGRRMFGRTRTNKIVVFDGSERHQGELLPVRVERVTTTTLYGDPAIHNL